MPPQANRPKVVLAEREIVLRPTTVRTVSRKLSRKRPKKPQRKKKEVVFVA